MRVEDGERFARSFVGIEPRTLSEIIAEASEVGVSQRRAREFLRVAEGEGMIESRRAGVTKPMEFLLADWPAAEAA